REHVLRLTIEFDCALFCGFLQRMPHNGACLVVRDFDGFGRLLTAIVWPGQIARQDVLGPLEELKADHRSGCRLGIPLVNGTPSKPVDLLARRGGLGFHRAPLLGYTLPWIGDVAIETIGMEAMDHTPCGPAQRDDLLALARSRTVWSDADLVIDFASGE